jgi:hypothetical protein
MRATPPNKFYCSPVAAMAAGGTCDCKCQHCDIGRHCGNKKDGCEHFNA